MKRYVYVDAEFIPNDLTNEGLLSLALVGMTGMTGDSVYMTNRDADWEAAAQIPFMVDHVLPHIDLCRDSDGDYTGAYMLSMYGMRRQVAEFFSRCSRHDTVVVARCGSQDLTRIHGLWDHNWQQMPDFIPHWFLDLEAVLDMYGLSDDSWPMQQEGTQHHALHDARYDREVHFAMIKEAAQRGVILTPRDGDLFSWLKTQEGIL